MTVKQLLTILLIFLNLTFCRAQLYDYGVTNKLDSLKILLNKAGDDTTRVSLLAALADAYVRFDPDTALRFALDGFNLAQQIKYKKGEFFCAMSLSRCWWSIGDYATAIKVLLPKINEVQPFHDERLTMLAYAALADAYRDQGSYDEALLYVFRAEDIIKKDLGCQYCRIIHANIASDYLGKAMIDSAQFYLKEAFTHPPDPGLEGWPFLIKGNAFAETKKYDSALIFYRQSIPKLANENNLKDLCSAFNSISNLFMTIGSPDSSIFYAHKSLEVSLPRKFAKEAMEAYVQLSRAYEKLNTDSALNYYMLAIAAKDSLYNQEKQRQILSYQFNEQLRRQEMLNAEAQYKNKAKIYVLLGAVAIFLTIGILLWRNNRHKQKANVLLLEQKEQTENALRDLRSTQAQLIHSEKMASLGELTAGIAHEIQNPLNFVNNFSEVNKELLTEMRDELDQGNIDDARAIANSAIENEEKIIHHGKRADSIVKGMLQHSRASSGQKEPTDINALADECLRLAYHGLRAKDKSFNVKMETDFDQSIGKINIVPQDIGRVLLNLFTNAFYSVTEKDKRHPENYEPTVSVSTKQLKDKVEIRVKDNGTGIPQKVFDKIFQPFFTTKPTGQGTGLGLSLSYDIVKAHGGEIKLETKENEFAEFTILLPSHEKV